MRGPCLFIPDPGYLNEDQFISFPKGERAPRNSPAVLGGNLSPGILLSAYKQGYFPWFGEGDPLLWWNPDPRFILYPDQFNISKSFSRFLKKTEFIITLDTAFLEVVLECSRAERPFQDGTWITGEIIEAYQNLHNLGYAHSVETWSGDVLVGGLYGVSLGSAFFGESMFFKETNASKTALSGLVDFLQRRGFSFVDCQVYTSHLESLGAQEIDRSEFLTLLRKALKEPTLKGSWKTLVNT